MKLLQEKKEKERVAVDVDETLLDFINPYLIYHNQKNKTKFLKKDIWNYNLSEVFKQTREEIIKELNDFYASQLFLSISPIKGAIEGIRYLRERYLLSAVTSRPSYIKPQTLVSLANFFNGSFELGISFVLREEKVQKYKDLEVQTIIDDDLQVARKCADIGMTVLLPDKRWNQEMNLPKGIIRVGNFEREEETWPEIQKII